MATRTKLRVCTREWTWQSIIDEEFIVTSSVRTLQIAKIAVFIICLTPLAWIVWRAAIDDLGANPVETISRYTGDWVLRFVLITLLVTPVRQITGWQGVQRFRRMLGLYSFFYVCLHFTIYLVDQYYSLTAITEDILKRPYITIGFSGFLMMLALAVTSTNKMVKRLGGRRWRLLHRLAYIIGIAGVTHYWWLVKSDITQPLIYASCLTLLLGYRLWLKFGSKHKNPTDPARAGAQEWASPRP